jgi:hypothetical protein
MMTLSRRACFPLPVVVALGLVGTATGEPADGGWWSWAPLVRPAVPAAVADSDPERAGNVIDRFLLARLREEGLHFSPAADRGTLIRRLYYDVVGLPPSPEEVAAFVADPDPAAYAKLVERLLASPHYGERWARHWLDVVHYGETHGYDKDKPRPIAWPYRDYTRRPDRQRLADPERR